MHLEISETQLILSCCVFANIVQFLCSVTKNIKKLVSVITLIKFLNYSIFVPLKERHFTRIQFVAVC